MSDVRWIPTDQGRVVCDLGKDARIIDVDYQTAYKFADAWLKAARRAEDQVKGTLGMTRRELDRFEENLLDPGPRLLGG